MKANLLIVDDLADSVSLLSKMLLRHLPGVSVKTALSGPEGISIAQLGDLDLVLLDAKMPGMDGFEVCRRLKADPKTAVVPVLMVSGVLVESRDRVAGLETGADGYICKPFEPEELIAQVKALLRVKRAEDELRRRERDLETELAGRTRSLIDSEQRFRVLFEKSPDAIFVEDANGTVLDANPAAAQMHEMTREQLIGRSVADLVPEEQRAEVTAQFPKWFTGDLRQKEGFSLTRKGRSIPVEVRGNRITFNGRPAVLLEVRDISARRESERALRQSEERYRTLVEDQADMICRLRPDLTLLFANRAFCQFYGKSPADVIGTHLQTYLPEGERSRVEAHLRGLSRSQPLQQIENLAISAEGHSRWVQWINRAFFDDQGRMVEIHSSGRDVTVQKRTQEAQHATALWLRALVDMADDLIACPDLDALYREVVEQSRARLGLERAGIMLEEGGFARGCFGTDLSGRTTDERQNRTPLTADWRERFRLRKSDEPRWVVLDEEYRVWDGQHMQYTGRRGPIAITPIQTASKSIGVFFNDNAITGAPLDPAKQEIVAVLCSLVGNIAERKAAESERIRLAAAVEQSAEMVMITDREGRIQYVNPGFERTTGYTREEAIGRTPNLLKSGRHEDSFFAALWSAVASGQVWNGRIINRKKDGSLFETETTISPVRDAAGKIISYLSVSLDVSKTVQMEAELRQSQKMESVGRLAGGIAHDFNNLLTAILGFSRLLQSELGSDHSAQPDVQEIINAGERASKLTKQLLAFGRKHMLQMQPIDLNGIVVNMDQILRRTLGEDIELVTMCQDGIGAIEADPGLIEQVVMNLAVNARDAMPQGGKLTISTQETEISAESATRTTGLSPGPHILLTVKDTGHGMPDHVRERIFEPFFTTKEKGKGSGLGLSTVYGIVKQCRGHIEVESAVNRGAEFRIYFPRHGGATPAASCPKPGAQPRGTESILLVEDEGTVRRLARRNLEALGYRVIEARHGEEALRVFRESKDPIDLVLTDVVMPCMGGPELVEHLRRIKRDIRVAYMSGFTEDVVLDRVNADHGAPLLLKPYTQELLAQTVRQALDRPASLTNPPAIS